MRIGVMRRSTSRPLTGSIVGKYQREVTPEPVLVGNPLVVVEEVAAAVENQLFIEYFDRANVVRRVTVDDIGARTDEPVCESHMLSRHGIPQLPPQ